MLTTIANVRLIPGLNIPALASDEWLYNVVKAADTSIKKYCKQELEIKAYTQYYDGTGQVDLIVRQRPLWSGTTSIAAGSNNVSLPASTINVASTEGFHPGIQDDPNISIPAIGVQTSPTTFTTVTYTGTTATSFTGCSGGTGTMVTGNQVYSPIVYFDPNGYYGTNVNSFNQQTQLTQGNNYSPFIDTERMSNRGLIRRVGGNVGAWWGGGYGSYSGTQQNSSISKLAASRLAGWPIGFGNLKVVYTAGWTQDNIPADLSYACQALVAVMIRSQPMGALLQSEGLGAYNYSLLSYGDDPQMGDIRRILARYRETSWMVGF